MKISTKTGDKGESGLLNGKRETKGADIFEFLGGLDELQSFLGWCHLEEACEILDQLQDDLFRMMAVVGNEMKCPEDVEEISEKDVERLEREIEKYEKFVGDNKEFVKPGRTEAGSRFHIARTVCRRVERSAVRYLGERGEAGGVAGREVYLKYLNRLSDLLFVLACKFEG